MNPARSHLQTAVTTHLQADTPDLSEFQSEVSYAEGQLPLDAPEDYQKTFSAFVSLTNMVTRRDPSDAHISEFTKLAEEFTEIEETTDTSDFRNRVRWLIAELPTSDSLPERADEDSAWGQVADAYLEPEQ